MNAGLILKALAVGALVSINVYTMQMRKERIFSQADLDLLQQRAKLIKESDFKPGKEEIQKLDVEITPSLEKVQKLLSDARNEMYKQGVGMEEMEYRQKVFSDKSLKNKRKAAQQAARQKLIAAYGEDELNNIYFVLAAQPFLGQFPLNIFGILDELGFRLDVKNRNGETPLVVAVKNLNVDAVAGIIVNKKVIDYLYLDSLDKEQKETDAIKQIIIDEKQGLQDNSMTKAQLSEIERILSGYYSR